MFHIFLILASIFLVNFVVAQGVGNLFSNFPFASQPCLSLTGTNSGCNLDSSVNEAYNCLCRNTGNFVIATAQCVNQDDPTNLINVWTTIQQNCAQTSSTLTVTQQQFFDAAAGNASLGTQTSAPTATSTTIPPATSITTATPPKSTIQSPTSTAAETSTSASSSAPSSTSVPHHKGLSEDNKIAIGFGVAGLVCLFLGIIFRHELGRLCSCMR
jgi:hypothetical protein